MVIKGSPAASVARTVVRDHTRAAARAAGSATRRLMPAPPPHGQAVALLSDTPADAPLPPTVPIGDYALTVDQEGNLAACHLPTGTWQTLMPLPTSQASTPDVSAPTTTQDGED